MKKLHCIVITTCMLLLLSVPVYAQEPVPTPEPESIETQFVYNSELGIYGEEVVIKHINGFTIYEMPTEELSLTRVGWHEYRKTIKWSHHSGASGQFNIYARGDIVGSRVCISHAYTYNKTINGPYSYEKCDVTWSGTDTFVTYHWRIRNYQGVYIGGAGASVNMAG